MMKRCFMPALRLFFIALTLLFAQAALAQPKADGWPKRVLITNDNGIGDVKLIELARAFAQVSETFVVAPLENKSGSTHYLSLNASKPNIEIERRSLGENITAYGVDGFPADCVVLGLKGLLRDNPPDLVVSGINGGPNLAADWIGSGTIGAARIAAFLGVPALAVSGLDDDHPESVAAATRWVVELARSKIVREMELGQYLTISIPRRLPSEIKGIDVVGRARLIPDVRFKQVPGGAQTGGREVWQLQPPVITGPIPEESDVAVYNSDRIAIVPMKADEQDHDMLLRLKKRLDEFPKWPTAMNKPGGRSSSNNR